MSKRGLSIIQMILICLAQIIVADSSETTKPSEVCLIILLAIAMIISPFLGTEGRK